MRCWLPSWLAVAVLVMVGELDVELGSVPGKLFGLSM